MFKIPSETLKWLLEDENPPVRNLTKQNLLGEELSEKEMEQVDEYKPIKTILSLMKKDGSWNDPKNPYKKYTGNYWQYIFLCDMNANTLNEQIKKASNNILNYQLPDGGFSHRLNFKKPILCLSANLLRSLVHFGYGNNEKVQIGIDMLVSHITEHRGVVCYDPIYILLNDCQMALTKNLSLFSTIDIENRNPDILKAIKIIEEKIAENQVFRYIPAGAKDFKKAIKGKKVSEIRKIKARMTNKPEKMMKTENKSSWKKFSFPLSYTSDILDTLYWLAKADVQDRQEFGEAIEVVINKMDNSGYWINESSYRNPFSVEIEKKNEKSKWLTYRACYILKKYRKIEFQD